MPITSEPAGARRPWPADHIEFWPIERLIPYAGNARVHTEADLEKIAAAIRQWGWTMPALVDEEGVLIVGHGRVAAAPRAEVTSIPVIVARGWSEEEKRAYRLADNQLAARADWDFEQLRNELQELGFAGFDVGLIGFEPDRLPRSLADFAKIVEILDARGASFVIGHAAVQHDDLNGALDPERSVVLR